MTLEWRLCRPTVPASIRHGSDPSTVVHLRAETFLDDLRRLTTPMMRGKLTIVVYLGEGVFWDYLQNPARDRQEARRARLREDLARVKAAINEEMAFVEAASREPDRHDANEVLEHHRRLNAAHGLRDKLLAQISRSYR